MVENEFEKNTPVQKEVPIIVNPTVESSYIHVNGITGPLVVFYGPRDIGKTVALLRLCSYLDKYNIEVDTGFRSDARYKSSIDQFDLLRSKVDDIAPKNTGTIDFLLLNIRYNGKKVCQLLEAPGEHFFKKEEPKAQYEPYLNQIFASTYQKVFVFFFSLNMFDDASQKQYSDKVAEFIAQKVEPKKDRVIIVCSKSNLPPVYYRDGKPIKSSYQKELFSKPGFDNVKEAIKNSGFKYVPFVPFSSGDFTGGDIGSEKIFIMSKPFYPKELWSQINNALTGKGALPWWRKIFG